MNIPSDWKKALKRAVKAWLVRKATRWPRIHAMPTPEDVEHLTRETLAEIGAELPSRPFKVVAQWPDESRAVWSWVLMMNVVCERD